MAAQKRLELDCKHSYAYCYYMHALLLLLYCFNLTQYHYTNGTDIHFVQMYGM